MQSIPKNYAVERDGIITAESDLSPVVRAILERMARVAYVLDCHRQAVAKHSQHLLELRRELDEIEGRRP
jgi:hypothetical protein